MTHIALWAIACEAESGVMSTSRMPKTTVSRGNRKSAATDKLLATR